MSHGFDDYNRFCPAEEHIQISKAICRGRRRSHYPKCPGCQFNDDEKEAAGKFFRPNDLMQVRVESAPSKADLYKLSRQKEVPKTPVGPTADGAFHGQDVFGLVPSQMTEDIAWRVGHATAQYLHSKLRGYERADPKTRAVVIGRDLRPHGVKLQKAAIEGIRSTGLDVVNVGEIDTPQLYFAVTQLQSCGGIHVTGGHLGMNYNGFRICGAKALAIGMETGLASIRDIAIRVPWHKSGSNSRMTSRDVSNLYVKFLRSFLVNESRLKRKLRVVVDASNGMAASAIPMIFSRAKNVEIIPLNITPKTSPTHGLDPNLPRNVRQVRGAIKSKKADFGVCLDGSGTRCVFVDDKGRTVRPDLMITLLAKMFIEREPGATIVYDHRCSVVTKEEIERVGGIALRERGEPVYIRRIMTERDVAFGGDLLGNFYFRDMQYCECATMALIHTINLLLLSGRQLSDMVQPLQRFVTSGDVRIACPNADEAVTAIISQHSEASIDHFDGITFRYPDWWFNIRPRHADSLVHVTVEARNRRLVDARLDEIKSVVIDGRA